MLTLLACLQEREAALALADTQLQEAKARWEEERRWQASQDNEVRASQVLPGAALCTTMAWRKVMTANTRAGLCSYLPSGA